MKSPSDCSDLSSVATSTLEGLRDALTTGKLAVPVTRAGLLDHGVHHQLDVLEEALSGHTRRACLTVLNVVLGERRARTPLIPELVWSGPERSNATARDTAVVLRALFERAQSQVIVAGYDFTRGSELLKPLWLSMRARPLDVRFVIHVKQPDSAGPRAREFADRSVSETMAQAWPFGEPHPRVYYDARVLEPHPRFNMHAKCVVVDGEVALITSANFTLRAHEHNTECGVLLEDRAFAHHLARQWWGLIESELVIERRV